MCYLITEHAFKLYIKTNKLAGSSSKQPNKQKHNQQSKTQFSQTNKQTNKQTKKHHKQGRGDSRCCRRRCRSPNFAFVSEEIARAFAVCVLVE
jgi:hypothetical protein